MGSKLPTPPPDNGLQAKPSLPPPPPPRRATERQIIEIQQRESDNDLANIGKLLDENRALRSELDMVRSQARTDNLRAEDADDFEQWLLDLGKLVGCGHVDEQLPVCIEREFQKMRETLEEISRLRFSESHYAQGMAKHALSK